MGGNYLDPVDYVPSVMEVEPTNKAEELGEEDLVDYEEEEDTTQAADKPAENGKEAPKKYAKTIYHPPPLSPDLVPCLCSWSVLVHVV